MDHYIEQFLNHVSGAEVKDYAVYLEKKSGFGVLNVFSSSEQLVIYKTERKAYACKVQGAGDFSTPIRLDGQNLKFEKNGKYLEFNGKRYEYVRKYKNGSYSNYKNFSEAVAERGNA